MERIEKFSTVFLVAGLLLFLVAIAGLARRAGLAAGLRAASRRLLGGCALRCVVAGLGPRQKQVFGSENGRVVAIHIDDEVINGQGLDCRGARPCGDRVGQRPGDG